MDPQPHSAEQFGEQRDFWWRRDFLDLMAVRWRLGEAASLVDIGCGVGHWSRLLYGYLRPPARLTGVDREPQWVTQAGENFRRAFPNVASDLFQFIQGDVTRLPLPDESFDVVTCQTVLMHLARPLDALREMTRILRPGGLLLCTEPNNLFNIMAFTSRTPDEPVEVVARRFEFWLRYHRGKIAAGQGNHSIGDLLPGYFARLGLRDIAVDQSDRAAPLFPPYATAEQKAIIAQLRAWMNSPAGPFSEAELRTHVRLGGSTEEFFNTVFAEIMEGTHQELRDIENGTFHTAGGGTTYLVSGRKSGETG